MGMPLDTVSQPRFGNHPLDPGDSASIPSGVRAGPWPHDTEALITFIETRFHAVHRRELPDLVRLARQVEASHKAHPTVPPGLPTCFSASNGTSKRTCRRRSKACFRRCGTASTPRRPLSP